MKKIELSNQTAKTLFFFLREQTPEQVVQMADDFGMDYDDLEKALSELFSQLEKGEG